jgi:hypothetical protein
MDKRRPLPGDIGLTQIKGIVGWLVRLLQCINGDFSKATHVFVVLDDDTVFEAQPGGAVITPLSEYDGRWVRYVDWPLTPEKRFRIVARARQYVGIGYNWTTYFYLAAYRLHIRPQWLKDRVQKDKRMICSQAADKIYADENEHLFSDGRMPYDLTPGDLARLPTWTP